MPASEPETASAPPLIVISYSKEDEKWKDHFVSLFPTGVDIRLVFNRVEDYPGRIDEETRSAIAKARVLVLLLSRMYLSTSWISNEQADYVSGFERTSGGLQVVSILLQDCSWEDVRFLQKYAVFAATDGKPIAEAVNDDQSVHAAVSSILNLAGLSHPAPPTSKAGTTLVANIWDVTSEVGNFRVSLEVRRVLGRAWSYVSLGEVSPSEITTELLFVALAEHGGANPKPVKTPQFLWKQLTRPKPAAAEYESLLKARFPFVRRVKDAVWNSHVMPPATKNTLAVFKLASEFARETYKPVFSDNLSPIPEVSSIGARHVLAALLVLVSTDSPSGALQVLSEITDVYTLRNRFFNFIVKSLPDDDHEAWRRILVVELPKKTAKVPKASQSKKTAETVAGGNIDSVGNVVQQTVVLATPETDVTQSIPISESPAMGSASEPLGETSPTDEAQLRVTTQAELTIEDEGEITDKEELNLKPILAGFATDYWDGRDLLDTEQDVNALASLVSAWSVEPPLSIGLFGDWGSGKSHFMRQMRKRVEKLSRSARKATDKKQKDIGYYKNIVQIEFNAWHYIEGNLWASLVDHIFANLRVTEKEPYNLVEKRRDQLMDDLGVKQEIEAKLKTKIEQQKTQLDAKKQEAIDRASQAETKREDASKALAGFRNEAETQLNELQLPINFSNADQELLERFGIKPSDLSTPGDVRKRYDELKGFWHRLNVQWKLFRTDSRVKRRWFFAALLVLIPFLGVLLSKLPQVKTLPAGLASALTFIATLYAAAKPTWDQFRKGLKALEEQDEAIEQERQKRMAELQGEVSALTKTLIDAENEKASIQTEIAGLEHKIETTTTSTILAEFIEDRAAASDYRRHLGLLALIRRDFEKLRDLFDRQRKDEKEGKENEKKNEKEGESKDRYPINRIVLYIDDLDRCPPQRVVEVLQAIHLLLAFPIFVVVVGVDARWVTRSLQESYEWLRLEEGDRKEDVDADIDGQDVQGATPHDYLEKIFQIPFWLRPMEETQTKTFIEGLTEQVRYKPPQEKQEATEEDSKGNKTRAQIVGPDLVAEAINQESAASGNGQPTQTVDDRGAQGAQGIVVTDPDVNKTVASPVGSKSGNDGGVVDETVAVDTVHVPDATTVQVNLAEQETSDKADDVAGLKQEAEVDEDDDDEEEIDLAPQSLTLGNEEIKYMKSIAKLIGRSPRAVKRFLNCYRLIKVSLSPAQLNRFVQEGASFEYRAVMILLGIVTGAPTVSLYVVEEIENWKWEKENPATMVDFLNKLEENEDLRRQPDWSRLKTFLSAFGTTENSAGLFRAFKNNTPKVSRYSFRISRAEAAGPKRASAPQSKQSTASKSKVPVAPKAAT